MNSIVITLILAARAMNLDPALLVSICTVETNLTNVVTLHDGRPSSSGISSASVGVCQVKPSTSRLLGIHPKFLMDVETNALVAAGYLSHQMKRYRGNRRLATMAYNGGTARPECKQQVRYYDRVQLVMLTVKETYGREFQIYSY